MNTGSSASSEILAAVVFDTALSDEQVAQISQELSGVPHEAQPDPHSGHVNLTLASIAAGLPTGVKLGTITVLDDGTPAVYVGSGGWQELTRSPLSGAPPGV